MWDFFSCPILTPFILKKTGKKLFPVYKNRQILNALFMIFARLVIPTDAFSRHEDILQNKTIHLMEAAFK